MQKQINSRALRAFAKLNSVTLEKLARKMGFCQRKPRKLSVQAFTFGLLESALQPRAASLRKIALSMSLCGGITYAKQSLWQRLKPATVRYMREVLGTLMTASLGQGVPNKPKGFEAFKRVLIQDSTCVKLHPCLAHHFPGACNHTLKTQSTLKLQATFDLLQEI